MGCEFGLPELAIERIQYFLTGKEAARTSLLSKSWRSAWLTRPDLDFDFVDLSSRTDLVKNTLKRYEKSNLKIDSFRLGMQYGYDHAVGFIARALKIGATHITLRIRYYGEFVLPAKLLFGSENLVALTVEGCEISRRIVNHKVRCSRLLSLCLDRVQIKRANVNVISHIISSCPLIQNLSLSYIYDEHRDPDRGVVVGIGNAMTMTLTNPHDRLRSLVLNCVYFDTLFLCGLSSNFPCLKYLNLRRHFSCNKVVQEEMLISSHSLERLHFEINEDAQVFKFDVPSIRKFTFEGPTIPSLSFSSTSSGGWESHVSIRGTTYTRLSTLWFHSLSQFLQSLGRSRIYLSLHLDSGKSFYYKVGEIKGLPTHIIENLTINLRDLPSLTWYALLDGLFLMCRPKLITPANNIDFIGKMLLHGLDGKFSTPINFMYGLNDLKEARAQIFDEAVSKWRDVPLDALLDDLRIAKGNKRFASNSSGNRSSLFSVYILVQVLCVFCIASRFICCLSN